MGDEAGLKTSLITALLQGTRQKTTKLSLSVFGPPYQAQNSFSYKQKKKIIDYLRSLSLKLEDDLKQKNKLLLTQYDQDFDKWEISVKEKVQEGKKQIKNAQDALFVSENSLKLLKAQFLIQQESEAASMTHNSLAWGLVLAAALNTSIFKRIKPLKQLALFATFGHFFSMFGSRTNLDCYFDSVYEVFEYEAVKYRQQELLSAQKLAVLQN